MNPFSLSQETVLKKLETTKDGLSEKSAKERGQKFGPNELAAQKKESLLRRFFAQFQDFMILVLLCAAAVSFFLSLLQGHAEYADPVIILLVVTLNAVLGVIQEAKAEHSLEALKKLSAPHANVLRDGLRKNIPSSELVPGDIIFLEAGNMVPADARLLKTTGLKADESSLTGESTAVEKQADKTFPEETPLGDRTNMVYSSSIISAGHGTAVVTSTGMNTEVGKIASMILTSEQAETPLQKRLAQADGTWNLRNPLFYRNLPGNSDDFYVYDRCKPCRCFYSGIPSFRCYHYALPWSATYGKTKRHHKKASRRGNLGQRHLYLLR